LSAVGSPRSLVETDIVPPRETTGFRGFCSVFCCGFCAMHTSLSWPRCRRRIRAGFGGMPRTLNLVHFRSVVLSMFEAIGQHSGVGNRIVRNTNG
jgi:hypothetical protein